MNQAKWENWTNLVLGIWFFITPWIIPSALEGRALQIAGWNSWVVGAVVAISAGLALQDLKPWEEWVNLVLGVWIVLSPWIFGYVTETGLLWNSVIVGAVIAVLSGFALPVAQKLQHQK